MGGRWRTSWRSLTLRLEVSPQPFPLPLCNEERGLCDLGHGSFWNHGQAWSLLTKLSALFWIPGTPCVASLRRCICTVLCPTTLRPPCRQGPCVIHLVIPNSQFFPIPVRASSRPSSCLILQLYESICPLPMHKPSHATLPLHVLIPLPSIRNAFLWSCSSCPPVGPSLRPVLALT